MDLFALYTDRNRCCAYCSYYSKNEEYYDLKKAEEQIKQDAKDFLDKKAQNGKIRFVLPTKFFEVDVCSDITKEDIMDCLE